MNINIETNATQQLTTAEVDLLAKHLCGVRLTLADSGVPTYNILSVTQQQGGLNATCSAVYKDSVDALALKGINVSYTTLYVRILDPEVFSVLDSLNIGNGTTITPALAAAATFGDAFKQNANIVNFDAYKYFTKQNGATDANASVPSFDLCTSLESIDITGAAKMPRFSKCHNLEYFHGEGSEAGTVIFGNITSIGSYTFENCSKLRRLILTNSLGTGSNAFLFSTDYPNNITRIDVDTIEHLLNCSWGTNGWPFVDNTEVYINNSKLTHLEVPNTISTIKNHALRNYKGLTALTLHGDMTIGVESFNSCSNLNAVYIDSLADWLSIAFNDQPLKYAHNLYINGSLVNSVTIPSDTSLTNKFWGNTSLESVIIENGMTSIGDHAFHGCTDLSSIVLPNTVTQIGFLSFDSCNINTIDLLYCTYIGTGAFLNCKNLSGSLNIPNLQTLKNNAFANANISQISNLGTIELIEDTMFYYCKSLTSVNLPSTVKKIGGNAFAGCSALISINIPSGVTSISQAAFRWCSSLTSINIPSSVTSIGAYAFDSSGYSEITDLNLPNLTLLGNDAFAGTKVQTISNLGSITNIPNACFRHCTALTSVTLPNSVTSIGNNTFYGCSALTSVTLPSSVETIGVRAFYNCNNLASITLLATIPPTLGEEVFVNNAAGKKIYVPATSVNTYKAADGWSTYAAVIEAIPTT